jgi:hypothetical protein
MATWDIAGTWVGEYAYDPAVLEANPLVASPVGFTLYAELGWLGRFRGSVRDDPRFGIPEPAAIVGRKCGQRVSFRKRYPRFYLAHQGQSMPLASVLLLEHGIMLDAEPPPDVIWYRGVFDPQTETVRGTWRINGGRVRAAAQGRVFEMATKETSGAWHMRRQG